MADLITLRVGSWLTAKAIESLTQYFAEAAGGTVMEWVQGITASEELQAVKGMHEDVRESMAALSESISELRRDTAEGTKVVLRAIIELRESQQHREQEACLRKAVDAMDYLIGGMYAEGNPKNVGLLEKASNSAQEAARMNGNFVTKLQAYRLWVVTEYMHEVATANGECFEAKMTAMNILRRVILRDSKILEICRKFTSPLSRKEPAAPELVIPGTPIERSWSSWSEGHPVPAEVVEAMEFLFDITSSVIILPPLDREVSYSKLFIAGTGESRALGSNAPHDILFAMGRYFAANPKLARIYPGVGAPALEAWNSGKEKLALDNFFVCTGGEGWLVTQGWTDGSADLGNRFGVTTDGGHVTKIILAANNLQGVVNDDLANCEYLRQLVLHGNNIMGEIPTRLQSLIRKNSMLVTGLPVEPSDGSNSYHRHTPSTGQSAHGQDLTTDEEASAAGTGPAQAPDTAEGQEKPERKWKRVIEIAKSVVGTDLAMGLKK